MNISKVLRLQNNKQAITAELLSAAKDHLKAGHLVDAITVISTLEGKGWGGIKTLRLRAAVQKRLSQQAEYGETLKRIADNENSAPSDLFQLAIYLVNKGDAETARAVMAPLESRDDCRHLALNFAYLAGLRSADLGTVRTALLGLLELDTPAPHLPELRLLLNEFAPADRQTIARAIQAKWPDKAAEIGSGGEANTPHSVNSQQRAAILATNGQVTAGQELLATGREADEELRYALTLIPPPETRLRALIKDNGESVIVSPAGLSGTTLLVFTGLADQAMVPIECIDAFCSAAGHSAIYLRDSSRSFFVGGVPDLAADFPSSLEKLREAIAGLGTQTLLCFGSSAGGFAAVRYGLELSASRVLCASGATCGREDFLEQYGDHRGRLVVRRLQRTFSAHEIDLYEQVAGSSGQTQIELCFGDGSSADVAHAKYLEGLPGVVLHPVAGLNRHGSFPRLMIDGVFQSFIAPHLQSVPASIISG